MYFTPVRRGSNVDSLRTVATSTGRKLALCGSHSASLVDAPWEDPSWEFWGHASSRAWYSRKMDRYFDLHPRICWTRGGKKDAAYVKFLSQNTTPIYMWDHYDEVPASVRYPKGRILQEYSYFRPYFTNQVAWMIALALTEGGVETIGLWGINYSSESEYTRQRGSTEFWLGVAAGRGVRVVLPEQCTLLREPALLYGYESHDEATGEIVPEYRPRLWIPKSKAPSGSELVFPPEIQVLIEKEEKENPRPKWSLGYCERSDGGLSAQEA
jgi:hypothetical protein